MSRPDVTLQRFMSDQRLNLVVLQGIEPQSSANQADVLPLNHKTIKLVRNDGIEPPTICV